ncbi:MAG TPA: hypothetical protein VIC56_02620 [Gemmatimonadota bacterium]|jgi:hypothetical protein
MAQTASRARRRYLAAARLLARAIGRHDVVLGVLLARSPAADDTALSRNDVEFLLVLRTALSGPARERDLLDLARRVRRLRGASRVLRRCRVLEYPELERWARTDPYGASLERRGGVWLHGTALDIPPVAIRVPHAVRRLARSVEDELPALVRGERTRDLRTLALELWDAYAVACGELREPHVTTDDAEAFYRAVREPDLPESVPATPPGVLAFVLELVARLHARLHDPLESGGPTLVFRARIPPLFAQRTVVALANPAAAPPRQALAPDTLVGSGEALDLYVRYANPFARSVVPEILARRGFGEPTIGDWVRCCLDFGAAERLRTPAFSPGDEEANGGLALTRLDAVRAAAPAVVRGEWPEFGEVGEAEDASDEDPGSLGLELSGEPPVPLEEYYLERYPSARTEADRLWRLLDPLASEEVTIWRPGAGRPA